MPEPPDLFDEIDAYINDLFAKTDPALDAAIDDARESGLPDIQISPAQGKLLYLYAKMIGAKRILEIGTLGGYSTIWLARALSADGRVVTLELDPAHAAVAARSVARADVADHVEIVVGPAAETLPGVIARNGPPFDLVFLDADKVGYPTYYELVIPHLRSGALILADNVIRGGKVLMADSADPNAVAVRRFNAMIAADARLEALVVQQVGLKGHDGLAIARVK